MKNIRLIDCAEAQHSEAIRQIYNWEILNTSALYDYKERSAEYMVEWFTAKRRHGFPVIGAVDDAGDMLGFATYGWFRPQPAYKYTVEHSIYVRKDARGLGIAGQLMRELIARAEVAELRALVGVIDCDNAVSKSMHEKMGFRKVGTMEQVGFKFGRWLSVDFYQLTLAGPANPQDG